MNWQEVGGWLKKNAGPGAALVGSLVTGNVPGAVAAGISMVSSVTGTNDPDQAMVVLQGDPQSIVRLKELWYQNEATNRLHLEEMTRLALDDKQKEHHETQETVRAGDKSEGGIRYVRPSHATISLLAAIYYALSKDAPSIEVIAILLVLPFTYAGLREFGKTFGSFTAMKTMIAGKG